MKSDNWREQLAELSAECDRRVFLRQRTALHDPAAVQQLYDEVVRLARVDLRAAARVAHATRCLAAYIKDDASRALGLRAMGHVSYLTGRHVQAVKAYEGAVPIYRRLGLELDVARTYSGGLQSLIYLGQYRKALSWAQRARKIFQKHGDRLRLARLDLNVGNIYYRQDRFQKALELYVRAHREFQRAGDPQDIAIALRNIAVCHISLNEFAKALEMYVGARSHCERHNMPVLVAEADYNIAYLYYLRGEYTVAIQMYEAARQLSERAGDGYHKALCDLDEAELYLEINLIEDGARMAQRAYAAFKNLGMRYEAAKALTFYGIATTHEGGPAKALALLRRARRLFLREGNRVWTALVDMYQAMILFDSEHYSESQQYCEAALGFLRSSPLRTRTALCELLLARLDLESGNTRPAERRCMSALQLLRKAENPALEYQAWSVLGEIQEARGRPQLAYRSYNKAHENLNSLRSQLRAEAKISFQKDKLMVYEDLVRLSMSQPIANRCEVALGYMEHAKSRSLADLMAFRSHALPGSSGRKSEPLKQVHELRQELNWINRRIELQTMEANRYAWDHIRNLRRRARGVEQRLTNLLAELWTTDEDYANLQTARTASVDEIRFALPDGTSLVEYYAAAGVLYAAVLDRNFLEVVPLAPVEQVRHHYILLQFQLSKFRLGAEYLQTYARLLRTATQDHLGALYRDLIAPIRGRLRGDHLIIVPHAFLHRLPFHALFDGSHYLIDEFAISYAPSASVFYLCSQKNPPRQGRSTVMGVPDPQTLQISAEVNSVAAKLPKPKVLVGPDATLGQFRTYAQGSRFLHIATHGQFRADNPMFSSIQLADGPLSLFDLYELRLRSELVTLSGCGTGLNVVLGGDELVGLVRGLLYSGAQAVLLTLWDVNDQSTAEFMRSFYSHRVRTKDKSVALKKAIQDLRQLYPDAYHWAPFVLIGKFFG